MEIFKAKQELVKLENKIIKLIRDYEDRTGLEIDGVSSARELKEGGNKDNPISYIKIKLSIKFK